VVVVVPTLAEREQPDHWVVAALVMRVERARAEHVTDRVDGEGRVACKRDPDEAAPEEAAPPGDEEGEREAREHPERLRPVYEKDGRVLQEPLAVALPLGWRSADDPAGVSVEEPSERAVWVAIAVGVGVVLQMVRSPVDASSLVRHRAEGQEHGHDGCARLEAAVRQEAMEAHRNPEPRRDPEAEEKREFAPADQLVPQQPDRVKRGYERSCEDGCDDQLIRDTRQPSLEDLDGYGETDGGAQRDLQRDDAVSSARCLESRTA